MPQHDHNDNEINIKASDQISSERLDSAINEIIYRHTEKGDFYLQDDIFPGTMPLVRNEEMNNLLSTADGTEITVTSAPLGGDISLSWLPYIPSIWSPAIGHEWALMNLETWPGTEPTRSGDAQDILRITGGTFSSKDLHYVSEKGLETNWSVGDRVALYNPFLSWDLHKIDNPIISNNASASWRSGYVLQGGLFKHSNGNYILLVNGTPSSLVYSQIGAFQSSDLINWTVLNNDTAVFVKGGTGWRQDAILASGRIFKLPGEDRYICHCYGYNATDAKYRIGWIKFDEDFSIGSIEYSSGEILDSTGIANGYYGIASIRYGSKWRMAYCNRKNGNPDTDQWETREAFADVPEGPFTYSATILTGGSTNDGSIRSSHTDHHYYFLWKGRLYLIIGCTSRYKYSGNRGNRVYGLFYWDEKLATPAWVENPHNPIFINPFYGDEVWNDGDWDWDADHLGISPTLFVNPTDGKLYMFFTANHGTDTYKIGVATIDLI